MLAVLFGRRGLGRSWRADGHCVLPCSDCGIKNKLLKEPGEKDRLHCQICRGSCWSRCRLETAVERNALRTTSRARLSSHEIVEADMATRSCHEAEKQVASVPAEMEVPAASRRSS